MFGSVAISVAQTESVIVDGERALAGREIEWPRKWNVKVPANKVFV